MKIMNFFKRPKSNLANRLFRVVFGVYFFIALITTVAQLYSAYINEEQSVKNEIDQLFQVFSPALTSAIWDFNRKGVEKVAQGLHNTQSVSGLVIKGDYQVKEGFILSESQSKVEYYVDGVLENNSPVRPLQLYAYHYKLQYQFGNETKILGDMIIYSDSSIVFSRSEHIFIATIINAVIKTVFLWLIFYFTIHYIVSIPLVKTTDSINQFNPDINASSNTPNEQSIDTLMRRNDELGVLVRAFLELKSSLLSEKQKLLSYQSSLEDTVKQRTAELEELATHDHLTGLYNRKAFDDKLDQCNTIDTIKHNFVLCFIDLDNFKCINDKFGHLAGDYALVQVAEMMRVCTTEDDFIARIGGDEFCIIFHSADYDDVIKQSETLRAMIDNTPFHWKGVPMSIGVSIGLSGAVKQAFDIDDVLREADAACYIAKSSGRNRVCTYNGSSQSMRR